MTPAEQSEIEARLRAELEQVSEELSRHQQSGESEVEEYLADSEDQLADKIRFALQRLREGTYESCANCGHSIPMERLQAKPSVSLCMPCQADREARVAASKLAGG